MILKSLLTLIGIGAMDHRQNALVHDLSDRETDVYAAHKLLTRRSIKVAETIVNDPKNGQKIASGVDDMRDVLVKIVKNGLLSDRIRATAEKSIALLESAREGNKCED